MKLIYDSNLNISMRTDKTDITQRVWPLVTPTERGTNETHPGMNMPDLPKSSERTL